METVNDPQVYLLLKTLTKIGGARAEQTDKELVIATFGSALPALLLYRPKPVHLVVDGLPAHKTALVKAYAASTNGILTLHFLPTSQRGCGRPQDA
jgi:hypothetical protein